MQHVLDHISQNPSSQCQPEEITPSPLSCQQLLTDNGLFHCQWYRSKPSKRTRGRQKQCKKCLNAAPYFCYKSLPNNLKILVEFGIKPVDHNCIHCSSLSFPQGGYIIHILYPDFWHPLHSTAVLFSWLFRDLNAVYKFLCLIQCRISGLDVMPEGGRQLTVHRRHSEGAFPSNASSPSAPDSAQALQQRTTFISTTTTQHHSRLMFTESSV